MVKHKRNRKIFAQMDTKGNFYIPKYSADIIESIPNIDLKTKRNMLILVNFIYVRTFIYDMKDDSLRFKFSKKNMPNYRTFAINHNLIAYNHMINELKLLIDNKVIATVGGYLPGIAGYSYRIELGDNRLERDIEIDIDNKREIGNIERDKSRLVEIDSTMESTNFSTPYDTSNYVIIKYNIKDLYQRKSMANKYIESSLSKIKEYTKMQKELINHYTSITSQLKLNHAKFRDIMSELTGIRQGVVGKSEYKASNNLSVDTNNYYAYIWQTLPNCINNTPVVFGESGRIYSILTNLKRELRQAIIYPTDMEKWDFKNSQYYFFLVYCQLHGYEIEQEIVDSINDGKYYELLYNKLTGKDGSEVSKGDKRVAFKKEAMKTLTDNDVNRWNTYKITKLLKDKYPLFYDALYTIKSCNVSLAAEMQKMETELCAIAAMNNAGLTIHDCLIVPKNNALKAVETCIEYFKYFNLDLKIEKE